MNHPTLCIALLAACLVTVTGAPAGDLHPPAGPVSPSMKTLREVEPRIAINATNTPGDGNCVYRISKAGSYYLTGSIDGDLSIGRCGIEIAASNVTVDLCGYVLQGAAGSLDGIRVGSENLSNLAVSNGVITHWGGCGVNLVLSPTTVTMTVENVRVRFSGEDGIRVGQTGIVRNCISEFNAEKGIAADRGAMIEGCASNSNQGDGIWVGDGSIVQECTIWDNTGSGVVAGDASRVADCTLNKNFHNGIRTGETSIVTGCTLLKTHQSGIVVEAGSLVQHCLVRGGDLHGIVVKNGSQAIWNNCTGNGDPTNTGAGILAFGDWNRVEGNTTTGGVYGIQDSGSHNLIAGNTSFGNSAKNFEITPGNFCLVVQGVPAGSISGNSGGVSPGSLDPRANFAW